MEVHHHSHTSRNKWTHYFWEFLMLFLAVFCGFFAEYQLEHKIERERAREYATQLYNDLRADSSDFNFEIEISKRSVHKLDTLSLLLNDYRNQNPSPEVIYMLSAFALRENVFEPITTAIEQLKNSGNLRYMGDISLRRIFSEYDVYIQILKTHYDRSASTENEIKKILTQILNIKEVSFVSKGNANELTLFSGKFELITSDLLLLKQYANWCILKQQNLKKRISVLTTAQRELRKLIQKLKDNFHFK